MRTTFSIRKTDTGYSFGYHDTERSLCTDLTRFELAALHEAISICLQQPPICAVSVHIASPKNGDG